MEPGQAFGPIHADQRKAEGPAIRCALRFHIVSTQQRTRRWRCSRCSAWSLLLGSGDFVLFGWLSDKIGRKPIILGGCLIAALTYFPLFKLLSAEANPDLHKAHQTIAVRVVTDPAGCSFQFNPTGTARFTEPCDIAKAALARASVN